MIRKAFFRLNFLLCMILVLQFFGCNNKSENLLASVFTDNELQTINKIIDYYDGFILNEATGQPAIENVYITYFRETMPEVMETGDLSPLLPGKKERIKFYDSLDRTVLLEIFHIQDSITIHTGETIFHPYYFSLNVGGKYMDFLKKIGGKNEFFKDYYNAAEASGDLGPSNYVMILKDFEKIDFGDREQRIVLIINLLRTGRNITFDEYPMHHNAETAD